MKVLLPLSIIFTVTTLFSCKQKEFQISSNNSKSERTKFSKINLDSTKSDSVRINLNQTIATAENIESQIKSGEAKFISFGIADQDFRKFKEKYGIDLKTNGCVIDTFSSKRAKQNNTFLAKYLTKKYGETWKKDLPFTPFGLDNI